MGGQQLGDQRINHSAALGQVITISAGLEEHGLQRCLELRIAHWQQDGRTAGIPNALSEGEGAHHGGPSRP